MTIISEPLNYEVKGMVCKGMVFYNEDTSTKKPIILVAHDWSGRNNFSESKAQELAQEGYIGFAIDMYGDGRNGETKEEKVALMQPLMQDRLLLQARITKALEVAKTFRYADQNKTGAIGFCFGGLCVLDLARSGAMINGIVSFHGLLNPPETANAIKTKILVLHGFDDPMVKPEVVLQFAEEMTKAQVDWQIHMYSNTMHAFTNPAANDPSFGTVFNKLSCNRAFANMKFFFNEIFNH